MKKMPKTIKLHEREYTVEDRDDVERIYWDLANNYPAHWAQEFFGLFEHATDWVEIEPVLYHGSPIPPEIILKEGLKHDAYLTPNRRIAQHYGKYLYRIDVTKLPPKQHLSLGFNGEQDEMATETSISPDCITEVKE
jgi:hypothetical protein